MGATEQDSANVASAPRTGKTDRRVKYTQMVLRQALLELMADRPIDRITVTDVCRRADVNRGTFYAHYGAPYELLEQIQDDLDASIKATLATKLADSSNLIDVLTQILTCISEQRALCTVLFSEYGDATFLKQIMYNAHDLCLDEWKAKLRHADVAVLDRFYAYTANGIAAVVQDWLREDMPEEPRQLARFIGRAINHGLSAFARDHAGRADPVRRRRPGPDHGDSAGPFFL